MPVMSRLLAAPRPATRTAVVLAAVALVLAGVGAPAARAHDELVATTPAADATVPTAPASVDLELSAPAQALGTQVVVTGPDGTVVSQGRAELRDRTVVQPVAGDLPGGTYTVAWRVTSSDGHPLSGGSAFTVAAGPAAAAGEQAAAGEPAAAGTPAPDPVAAGPTAAAPDGAAATQPAASSTGSGWIAGAAGVVVLAAGAVLLRSRRRG
jgi:hypothetical protein